MGTHTQNVVRAAVAIAEGDVNLAQRTAIHHQVDVGHRVDVHQTYLMADAVVRQIDQTHLPTLGALTGHVEQTDLGTIQRVGIVDGSQLQTAHHGLGYVQHTRYLRTTIHARRHVVGSTYLPTVEDACRSIGKT